VNPERFRLAAALPSDGGWRLELVLDRSETPPRPVVLARVPPEVARDARSLTALLRGVEQASRVEHAAILPVLGLVEAGGGLAVLSDWREGDSLRALLDAGGALPAPLAARVLLEVAGALRAIHAEGVTHGDLRAEHVHLTEDGGVLLGGLARRVIGVAGVAVDAAALARLATECLGAAGEGSPAAALARAAQAATSLGSFVEALREAGVEAATAAELATRLRQHLPADGAARAARRLALSQARQSLAPPADDRPARPAVSPPPLPGGARPPANTAPRTRPPPSRPAAAPRSGGAASAPARAEPLATLAPASMAEARLVAAVGAGLALVGLAVGYLLGR